MRHLIALPVIWRLFAIVSNAQVKLPHIISNEIVLKRDTELKIWGWATKDEKVTVGANLYNNEGLPASPFRTDK